MTGFRRNNRFGVGKSYFDSSSSLEDETLAFLNNLDVANAFLVQQLTEVQLLMEVPLSLVCRLPLMFIV